MRPRNHRALTACWRRTVETWLSRLGLIAVRLDHQNQKGSTIFPEKGLVIFVLLLLAAATAVQAQTGSGDGYVYTTNSDLTITIIEYIGTATSVTIPSNINGLTVTGIEGADNGEIPVFSTNLTSVTIPNSVTTIGEDAFGQCYNLSNVTMTAGITNIGYAAFQDCGRLTSLTIPGSVTSIGSYAFIECGLTNLTLNSGLNGIGDLAFWYCSGLTQLTIPGSVTSIGEYAFADCSSLSNITFLGNLPGTGGQIFNNFNISGIDPTTVYYLPGSLGWSSSLDGIPAVPLTTITITANPTNGAAPLAVQFTSSSVDGIGNTVGNWNWDFGDGSTSTAQNPSHIYLTPGTFPVSLTETNSNGLLIAGYQMFVTISAFSGLVLNGNFETGAFTDWTLSGNTNLSVVGNASTSIFSATHIGITPYSGNYEAILVAPSSLDYLSQTIPTTPGASYLLSFWVRCYAPVSAEFLVSWNGNTLFQTSNPFNSAGWTNMQFVVSASGTSTVLQFGFFTHSAPANFFCLDDVTLTSEQPGIAGISQSGANLVLSAANGLSGHTYYVLMGTNMAQPLSQWTPVATNVLSAAGNFTVTATNAVTGNVPQRFYILETQ